MEPITYRRAKPSDTRNILKLINAYSAKGVLLPRSFGQVIEKIRDFSVAIDNNGPGDIVGVVALQVVGEELAEVRSLAVDEKAQHHGVGQKLMELCVQDAKELGLQRIFALTYKTEFFAKQGFVQVEKLTLPQKIWSDCIHCAKFSDCDEIAMLRAL